MRKIDIEGERRSITIEMDFLQDDSLEASVSRPAKRQRRSKAVAQAEASHFVTGDDDDADDDEIEIDLSIYNDMSGDEGTYEMNREPREIIDLDD